MRYGALSKAPPRVPNWDSFGWSLVEAAPGRSEKCGPPGTPMGGGPESLGVSRGAVFAGCRRQGGATVSENAAPRRRKGQIRAARPVSGCRRPFPPPEPRRTRRVHRGASLTVGRRGVEPPKPLQSAALRGHRLHSAAREATSH